MATRQERLVSSPDVHHGSMDNHLEIQHSDALALLEAWVQQRITAENATWLQSQIKKTVQSDTGKELYVTLGMIPRKLGKTDLGLTEAELGEAEQVRPGWDPSLWSIAGSARILVIATLAKTQGDSFGLLYRELCRTADLSETIELYSALPLLPRHKDIDLQVGDGLRTNMKAVFESIAHRNPFPKETFDDNRWNHLVLKALFIDSTLAPIQGLDQRANDELAGILCDYAHERWAAGRKVSCELWRCVGPFATGPRVKDLARALDSETDPESQAAAIALAQSPDPAAEQVLSGRSDLRDAALSGALRWEGESTQPVFMKPI